MDWPNHKSWTVESCRYLGVFVAALVTAAVSAVIIKASGAGLLLRFVVRGVAGWATGIGAIGFVSGTQTWLQNWIDDYCDPASPLVLDLDGDGVEAGALAHFDHAGDGWNELSRWAGEDDGVLVWDRNGDGATAKMTDVWFVTNPALTTYSRAGLPA